MVYISKQFGFLFLLNILTTVVSFYPNSLIPFLTPEDYTRMDITELGILYSVYGVGNNFSNAPKLNVTEVDEIQIPKIWKFIENCYGGKESAKRLKTAIDEIIRHMNKVDQNHACDPEWYFSNEKILEGNEKLKHLRDMIIDLLQEESPNYQEVRKYLGQSFHLLLEFYSNTNWVEGHGQAIFTDLGISGKPILPVAPKNMSTCRICRKSNGTNPCQYNLLDIGEMLTSGYWYGRHACGQEEKQINAKIKTGKCSHGGVLENHTPSLTASGGINKDTTMLKHSPHFQLHKIAALTAIQHVLYFLTDEENGIIKLSGQQKFENMLGLKLPQSVIFVIDISTSMEEEVKSLRSFLQTNFKDTLHTYQYWLITIENNKKNTSSTRFSTAQELLKALEKLKYQRKGGCQVPILTAIRNAVEIAPPFSKIFVLTDSSPSERSYKTLNGIQYNHVEVNFITTGSCHPVQITFQKIVSKMVFHRTSRDSRSIRIKRSSYQIPPSFTQIALNSGGQVYQSSKSSLTSAFSVLNMGSSITPEVTLIGINFPGGSGGFSKLAIPVDNTITKLTIIVDGLSQLPSSRILDNNGNVLIPGLNGLTNVTQTDHDTISVTEIKDPKPGTWHLEKITNIYWKVDIKATSILDFTSKFMKLDANGYSLYEISGNPIIGSNLTVVVTVNSPDKVTDVDDLLLLDDQGQTFLYSKFAKFNGGKKQGLYSTSIIIPSKNFQIAIDGYDINGILFRRTHPAIISPVTVELEILPLSGPLYVSKNLEIPYIVTNVGPGKADVVVSIKDNKQFIANPFNRTHTLDSGENATDKFIAHGGHTKGITSTITVTAEPLTSYTPHVQLTTFQLTTEEPSTKVIDTTPPRCTITKTTGTCANTTTCDCNVTTITTEVEIFDVGEGLRTVTFSKTGTAGLTFSSDPFTPGLVKSSGVVKAKLISDCCRKSEEITMTDWKFTAQCTITMNPSWVAGPCTTTTSTTTPSTTTTTTTTVSTTTSVTSSKSASQSSKAASNSSSTSNLTNDSGGLSETAKIAIGTSAGALSVAAIFTGGILLKKKFTSVSPD